MKVRDVPRKTLQQGTGWERQLSAVPVPLVFGTRCAGASMGSFSLREKPVLSAVEGVRMRGCQLGIVDWGLPIEEKESPEYAYSICNLQSAFRIRHSAISYPLTLALSQREREFLCPASKFVPNSIEVRND